MPTTTYEGMTLKQIAREIAAVAKALERNAEKAEQAKPSLEAEAVTLINKLVAKQGLPPAKSTVAVEFPQNGNGNGTHKAKAKRAKRGKIAIKYRDPANPQNTWSGRGRPAKWLAALEGQGHKRSEYAVR